MEYRSGVRCHPHDTYSIELNGTEQSKVPAYCASICCLNVSESIPFQAIGVTLKPPDVIYFEIGACVCAPNGKSNNTPQICHKFGNKNFDLCAPSIKSSLNDIGLHLFPHKSLNTSYYQKI